MRYRLLSITLVFFLFVFGSDGGFAAIRIFDADPIALPDTARSRDDKPSKERVPKNSDGKERSRSSGSSSSESGDFFSECAGSCMANCLESMITSLFSGSDDNTNNLVPNNDSTAPKLLPIPRVKAQLPQFGIYTGLTFGAEWMQLAFSGESKEKNEYINPGFSINGGVKLVYHDFFFDLNYGYASMSSTPKFDYVTTIGDLTIKDVLRDSKARIHALSTGIGYIFNISAKSGFPFFGFGAGAGISYFSIKEEGTIDRYQSDPRARYAPFTVNEKLSFTSAAPYILLLLNLIPAERSPLMFDLNIRYSIIGRDPERKASLPLDWNKINGALNLCLGIRFNVL